jgi:hypothetical protein
MHGLVAFPPDIKEQVLQPGHRRYTIAIPKGYTSGQPVPLVLALHFGGSVTPFYGKLILTGLVEPALRKLGAIIVAPDCTARDWTQPQSEADVLALLDSVQDTYYVIHSRQDEVMPLEPIEKVVRRLKAKGVSVELVVLDGVTHYETSRFVEPLRAAVLWIEGVWR